MWVKRLLNNAIVTYYLKIHRSQWQNSTIIFAILSNLNIDLNSSNITYSFLLLLFVFSATFNLFKNL